MEQWKQYKLGDIASLKYGKLPPKNNSGYYPIWSGYRYVGFADSFNCKKGTIIVVARGVGGTGDVKFATQDCFLTNLSISVEIDSNICNPRYFYYLFQINNLRYLDSGSAQSQITIEDLKRLQIYLPKLHQQNKIVNLLSSLDNKIELNRRINDNLEQQALALFKSWFVDFEPFKDGEFVDSELGMIPKGWRIVCLGEVTKECKDKVGKRQDVRVLSPVTTGELLLSEEYFTKQVFSDNISKYIVVKPNEFAYNPARVNIGSLGINTFRFDGCVSPVYVVFKTEQNYHHFFNLFRKREAFKIEINSRAIGGVRQTLSYKDFSLIKLVYPPQSVIAEFNATYLTLLNKIESAIAESKHLAMLRDTLLPRLMSGELKINDLNC